MQAGMFFVSILVKVIDALGIKLRSSTFDAVDFIPFFQQKFCKIRTVLPGYSG